MSERYTIKHDWMLEIHDNGQEIIKTGNGCPDEHPDHPSIAELVRRANAYDQQRQRIAELEFEVGRLRASRNQWINTSLRLILDEMERGPALAMFLEQTKAMDRLGEIIKRYEEEG